MRLTPPPDLLNKLAIYPGVAYVENIVNSSTLLEKDQQQSLLDILQTTDPDASIPDTIIITTDLKHQDKIKNMLSKQFNLNAYQLYAQHPPYSLLVCFVFFMSCLFFFKRQKPQPASNLYCFTKYQSRSPTINPHHCEKSLALLGYYSLFTAASLPTSAFDSLPLSSTDPV